MTIHLWVDREPGAQPKVCSPERFAQLKREQNVAGRLVAVEARLRSEAVEVYHRWTQALAEASRVLGVLDRPLSSAEVAAGLAKLAAEQPQSAGLLLGSLNRVRVL